MVTAGPTQEAIDPVRFISNHSTGRMGYAIAEVARDRGAQVVLVSGPVSLEAPEGVELVNIVSAQDLFDAVSAVTPSATRLSPPPRLPIIVRKRWPTTR